MFDYPLLYFLSLDFLQWNQFFVSVLNPLNDCCCIIAYNHYYML